MKLNFHKFAVAATLALFAAVAASPSFAQDAAWRPGADADKTPKPTLPDWATAQIDETFARFQEWKGDDVVFSFPTITDVHSPSPKIEIPINWSDSKTHIFFMKAIGAKFGSDFIADLGDMGLDSSWTKPQDVAQARLKTNALLYADSPIPVIFALGNHDHNSSGDYYVTSEEFGATFTAESKRRGLAMQTGPKDDYGFVDFPAKKCRLVFLNTSDEKYYGYSRAQLQFLADSLASTPTDYTVTIIEHFCVLFDIGHWTNCMDSKAFRDKLCMKIFDAFVAGTDGTEDEVSWNFSKRGPGALSCVFHGDSHFDHHAQINGVNYAITQGYGGCDPTKMAPGAVRREFNRGETMLIDVVAVKPEKREVRIFRVGIGGAEADRGFNF